MQAESVYTGTQLAVYRIYSVLEVCASETGRFIRTSAAKCFQLLTQITFQKRFQNAYDVAKIDTYRKNVLVKKMFRREEK